MNNNITYETERLMFRPWTMEDAESCFRLASDEHIGPPCGWMPHESVEETKIILRNILINDYTFCIIEKESGEIVGNIGIDAVHDSEKLKELLEEAGLDKENADELKERELGFWIGYPYWNKGYMTEAVLGTIDYCFNELGLKRLWCGNFSDNPASGRVQEKCGFKYEYTRKDYAGQIGRNVEIITRSMER